MEIERAIAERLVVELEYDGGMRLVEPHALFVDREGCHLVRAWQVDGFTHAGNLPQWRSFKVQELAEVRILRTRFSPRPDLHAAMQRLDVANVIASIA